MLDNDCPLIPYGSWFVTQHRTAISALISHLYVRM